jgi:sec-independent protein translocase protein TatB
VLNLDPAKLLVIAVVAVILLGPDRLPQVARQVGGAWRSLNDFRHRMESEVRTSIPDLPSSADIARLARSPSALLDHLSKMDQTSADPAGDESPVKSGTSSPAPAAGPAPTASPATTPPVRPNPLPNSSQLPANPNGFAGDPSLN